MEVDHVEVIVEDSSHAMKKNEFAQLDLRATRQPQALNRHGSRAARYINFDIADVLKGGGRNKKLTHFLKGFYRAVHDDRMTSPATGRWGIKTQQCQIVGGAHHTITKPGSDTTTRHVRLHVYG